MNFTDAVKSVLTINYANFQGRAARSEFWWYVLFVIIASVVLNLVDGLIFTRTIGTPILGPLFSLATIIPGIAVSVRRLHDKDKSGWFVLLALIPIVGTIILIVWYATEGTPGPNRFGPPAAQGFQAA
jgi:uncharacterized membrane protein YhaH (DUF805 family)